MKLILCSGGIDSLVCAERARKAGELAGCLFVDYGHPAQQPEGWKVFAYCGSREIPLKVVHAFGLDLAGMGTVHWTEDERGVKVTSCCARAGRDYEANGHRVGCPGDARVVPARNAVLLAMAANAAGAMGADTLVIGANAADQRDYIDCRPGFLSAVSAGLGLRVEAPLIDLAKPEIVAEARALGLRRGDAWSCYEGGPKECGACASCAQADHAWLSAEIGSEVAS